MKLPFLKRAEEPKNRRTEEPETKLGRGITSIKDIIAPAAIEVDFNHFKIENTYFRTLFVAGYPRFVSPNWLAPLITFDRSLDVSMFIYPIEGRGILDELRRKIGEMEAEIQTDIQRGRIPNVHTQISLEDAKKLQEQLAKGAERFFQLGLYITIPADSTEELKSISQKVEATLGSLMIIAKPTTLQMEDGFLTTLPICDDKLMITRNMDTTCLATTFPFTSSELSANEGILYGINEHNGSLITFDRFSLENYNLCLFGKAGSGKSVDYRTSVLVKQGGEIKQVQAGDLVEKLIEKRGVEKIDEEMEGVVNPGLEVFTFDKNLKGKWAKVTVAARKPISKRSWLYKITTKSGREIIVTTDHNLIVLRNGKIRVMRGQAVKIGESIPLPRFIPEPTKTINSFKNVSFTPELFEILGFYTSEGNIAVNRTCISTTHPEIINHLKSISEKLDLDWAPLRSRGRIEGIRILSKSLVKFLHATGAIGTAGTKRVPSILWQSKNKLVAAYLRAYFEGDGTVGLNGEVSATSKSKELISDLAYLLLRFKIVGRIRKKFKRATNSKHKGNWYYFLTISGRENLLSFAKNIGFITCEKNEKLKKFLNRTANTNVDTIPTLDSIFRQIYKTLYSSTEIKMPAYLSDLKNGKRAPSRKSLKRLIKKIEKRIKEIKNEKERVYRLKGLPKWQEFAEKAARRKKYNRLLWQELGQSWQLMKRQEVVPMAHNMFRAMKTVNGDTLAVPSVSEVVYDLFQAYGESLRDFDVSLWSAITQRKSNTSYEKIWQAGQYLAKRHRQFQFELMHLEKKLNWLKTLANSNLFWDPIIKIEKIRNKDNYVYDLTVDNEVFLAGFGGMFVHNSYCAKLEILRSLMFGTDIIIIDPENEYQMLSKKVEGEYIDFSFRSQAKINPFDLGQIREEENPLAQKILSLHALLKIILGEMSPDEDATLDRALVLTYRQKGITQDPSTYKNEPPLMEDLYKNLFGMEEREAKTLANRLERYVKGSLAGIFNQKSNVEFTNPFTVFGIKNLETELRPAAMFIILDFIWNKIKSELKKRILVVDEAWYLMRHEDSAMFLYSLAKRARKYYLGLTTITQDVEDFLESKHGKAIINNSSIQILMKQSPAAIDKVGEVFYLSEGEKNLLLSADIGYGLFFAGPSHVAVQVVASEEENQLITTKPAELIAMRKKTVEEMKKKEKLVEETEEVPPPIEPAPKEPLSPSKTVEEIKKSDVIEELKKQGPIKIKEEKSDKIETDEQTEKGLYPPRTPSSQPGDRSKKDSR